MQNPIGFGPADFLELIVAVLLVAFLFLRPVVEPWFRTLALKPGWCMLLLALLPVALRLALLPHHPVPSPEIYDEFSHLLVADTLRHLRLANPPHALHPFFETFFVLQEPTYSSIYPIGQGLGLALGSAVFGLPWAGVLLATAAFCALCYWMLCGWTTRPWALLGGLLAVIEFGPLNPWMNCYWGGASAAAAGCLVFGALPRLRAAPRVVDGAWLGLGLALHLLTRPFESVFLLLSIVLYFLPVLRTRTAWLSLVAPAAAATLVVLPAIFLTLLQNQRVTGSWTTLPYQLSQYQYGVPSTLTVQDNPVPHRDLTPQQQLDYKMQLSFHGPNRETLRSFLLRLGYRARFYRFYFLVPLYLALPAFLLKLRRFRFAWVLGTVVLFALGTNLFPAFQFHYVAAVACLFLLMSIAGLQRLGRWPAQILLSLCVIHFIFWYSLHLFDDSNLSIAMRSYETWNGINHADSGPRAMVGRQLGQMPGKQLIFVRYWPQHLFQEEWVYNDASIDDARVVWARDRDPEENQRLLSYYPNRTAWLLEPDARPPKLTPYIPEPVPAPVPKPSPEPDKPKLRPLQPNLRFENVK